MKKILPANIVMKTLLSAESGMTRDTLALNIEENFGHDIIFEKCSGEQLRLDEVIQFMLSKNKLIQEGSLIKANLSSTEGHC